MILKISLPWFIYRDPEKHNEESRHAALGCSLFCIHMAYDIIEYHDIYTKFVFLYIYRNSEKRNEKSCDAVLVGYPYYVVIAKLFCRFFLCAFLYPFALYFSLHRNPEKRKEKSRDAARSRRGKEADVFAELSSLVPIRDDLVQSMDKASVMRLAISHVKLRTLMSQYYFYVYY